MSYLSPFLLLLLLLLFCCTSYADESVQGSRRQRDTDISSIRKCANSLSGCPTPPRSKLPTRCNHTSDCTSNQYCHSIFKMCLTPLKPAPPKPKPPHERVCTSSADCGIDQVCHAFFGKCLPSLPKASPITRARRIPNCANTTDCSPGQYCHDHFRICLPNLTKVVLPTSTTPSWRCSSDADCGSSEFCHSLTHLCLRLLNTPTPTPSSGNGRLNFCLSDSDCKLSEICHFLIGMQRSSRDLQGGTQAKPRKLSTGICIPNKKLHSASFSGGPQSNCSRSCGSGSCCLESAGICSGYRLRGDICMMENVAFLCPCFKDYECVSTGKKMGMKKLEKKIAFPMEVRAELAARKRIKFKVGRCRRKP